MKTIIYFLILFTCVSCASIMWHGTERFNGPVIITTFTDSDTTCVKDFARVEFETKVLRARIPFTFLSSGDSLVLDLHPNEFKTYQAIDHKGNKYEVTFPGGSERREGILFGMREETRYRIVGAKCYTE